ncbi:uncharacterized protein BBA_04792 [Beauveria bassiana ARSEF 2860]|uniref:GPI anchored protein n=1 Tax=Beauveria bassiana (strain ARSEF 2860) TaxID=655819 RepID=J4KNU2_BEAB2|nr:uncharacterized protein BBA_04792 [Beauveria bassiana ARSEF 2860]EJP66299.1 hypothetical protein BBA_04792 [Beauveria bassiana ARSEF 2860]
MKFNAALIAAVAAAATAHGAAAATAHGAAVEADDFSDLDAFVGNIPTDALQAAQSSIAAGVQPTPDATEATTPAETSQVAAIVNADDGLPSEEDIDKLIASADAQFGNPGDNKGLPAPPAAATAAPEANANAAQATPRDADQPAPEVLAAINGVVAFAKAAAATGTAPGYGSVTATGGAATATGLVVDNSGNGTAPTPNQVWTAAAAPRQAVGGLAVAGMIAAYFL